jgi:hypothetical protein
MQASERCLFRSDMKIKNLKKEIDGLKKEIDTLKKQNELNRMLLDNHKTYDFYVDTIGKINPHRKCGLTGKLNLYFNEQSCFMTFNSIKENDVVVLRVVKSKDPKFEHQAYIYYVCKPWIFNDKAINDGCYLGLCPFPPSK